MMKNFLLSILIGLISLPINAKTMKDIMASCDDEGYQFSGYVMCLKKTYIKDGDRPSHPAIRSFFADLELLVEMYEERKISNSKAKSITYKVYLENVKDMDEDWTDGLNRFARELRERNAPKSQGKSLRCEPIPGAIPDAFGKVPMSCVPE